MFRDQPGDLKLNIADPERRLNRSSSNPVRDHFLSFWCHEQQTTTAKLKLCRREVDDALGGDVLFSSHLKSDSSAINITDSLPYLQSPRSNLEQACSWA